MSFATMKKSRMSFETLAKKVESDGKGGNKNKDERLFYPQLDENKNGYAVIRFLPGAEGDESPWQTVFSHGFQGNGGWYIEECPTTIGVDCPVCKNNGVLWNSGIEADKKLVSGQNGRKRRKQYIANILVIQDKANPENEGKVFLFKFGAKIFDKLKSAMHPDFEDETPVNPFDMWDGANFKLKIRKFEGNINYDKSEFEDASPIASTDKAIEAVWKQQYPLAEFVSTERFKAWDELEKQFARAIGAQATPTSSPSASAPSAGRTENASTGANDEADAGKTVEADSGESEDAMDYFRQLKEDA